MIFLYILKIFFAMLHLKIFIEYWIILYIFRISLRVTSPSNFSEYLMIIQGYSSEIIFFRKWWNCLKLFIYSGLLLHYHSVFAFKKLDNGKNCNLKYTVQTNIKFFVHRVKHPTETFQRIAGNRKKHFKI